SPAGMTLLHEMLGRRHRHLKTGGSAIVLRACLSSRLFRRFCMAGAMLAASLSAVPLVAEEVPPPGLPILFDSRERLPKPDLSSLVRLRFLTSVDFPPFNFADQNGKLAGFHVDL